MSEKRDLKKDLEYINDGGIRVGIPCMKEWLNRAITAEDVVAILTEENDIQRQAIQNLSAQVAGLRDEVKWIKDTYETDFTETELECLCPREAAIYQTVKEILASTEGGDE